MPERQLRIAEEAKAGQASSATEINILEVQVVSLIESTQVLIGLTSHEHERAGQPGRVLVMGGLIR
jgi:hypothetical protein